MPRGINFFFSSRRRHTRFDCDWSSDVCSSDLETLLPRPILSGPSRLAIDTDWQSVCLEFESSGRGPLLLANRESLSDSNLSRSEERRVEKECRSRWSPYH